MINVRKIIGVLMMVTPFILMVASPFIITLVGSMGVQVPFCGVPAIVVVITGMIVVYGLVIGGIFLVATSD